MHSLWASAAAPVLLSSASQKVPEGRPMAPAPPRAGPPGVHLGLLPKLQEVGNVWRVQCVSFVCPCNAPGRGQAWALPTGEWTLRRPLLSHRTKSVLSLVGAGPLSLSGAGSVSVGGDSLMAGWVLDSESCPRAERAKAGRVQVLTAGVWLVPGEDPAALAHQLTHCLSTRPGNTGRAQIVRFVKTFKNCY